MMAIGRRVTTVLRRRAAVLTRAVMCVVVRVQARLRRLQRVVLVVE
jgi:hypothetical protein